MIIYRAALDSRRRPESRTLNFISSADFGAAEFRSIFTILYDTGINGRRSTGGRLKPRPLPARFFQETRRLFPAHAARPAINSYGVGQCLVASCRG